ncbi:integrase/recombinase XerD [Candidatus Planktophila lacus]|jgi:integrase/recombinase XerD|uniref:site-specific tyrosine recombinase XerD n=1 Tax=Candidatus Planktophila lacus TaxID=1884913 RepID=UPI000BACB164|nr:site-specific tyrosine recombinase XerD [Candidatus Planktophila lacus]ASY25050.1 integrase/recombinase XerD [Candidatus Planktophila lacus]
MKFENALQSFVDHLTIERGLSSNSISAYKRDLAKFSEYLVFEKLDFERLSEDEIISFEVWLKGLGMAVTSINRNISALKSFYKYLAQEFSTNNPVSAVASSKVPRRLPKALTIKEITSLIDSTKREGDPISLRDHAIIELLYGTGARVSEIVGIDINDFAQSDIEGNPITTLKLRGKGSKERIVPLGSFAKSALDEYLVRIRPNLLTKSKSARVETALFLNQRGSRLSRQSAWQMISDAADSTGLSGKVSPHVFRHSYATHLLDGGADIRVVQELLGHASVTTTQIYTLITIDKVREAYATAHPRAN